MNSQSEEIVIEVLVDTLLIENQVNRIPEDFFCKVSFHLENEPTAFGQKLQFEIELVEF